MFSANELVNWFRTENYADMRIDENVEPLTQMKAMKLLYYAQGIMLGAFNEKLFNEDILAWEYGPVVRSVHDMYKGQRAIVVFEDDGLPENVISDHKKIENENHAELVLQTVKEYYGDKSASQLVTMTHNEQPWSTTPRNGIISTEKIKNYFESEVLA